MFRFASIIFLSAFLLFQIQPIIAKYILPWFGGSSNVWTICLLFFQVTLLAGYTYAHLLNKFFSAYKQILIHTIFVACALFILPITPDDAFKPDSNSTPISSILLLLTFTIGIPYALISASGPLFQRLFEYKHQGHSTYRLYALSNIGSLLGLLTYPFFIEPIFSLNMQTYIWSFGFVAYFLLCLVICFTFYNKKIPFRKTIPSSAQNQYTQETWKIRILWLILAGLGSSLLLSTTNQICLDIASIPFLWIIPLSLYLISFIICFDKPHWYKRIIWIPIFFVLLTLGVFILLLGSDTSITLQVTTYASILFVGCMITHGELNKIKPHPSHLTEYYLIISFGGALGAVFVSLIAPNIFNGYWELHISWLSILILAGVCIFRDKTFSSKIKGLLSQTSWSIACAIFGIALLSHVNTQNNDQIYKNRNFYGILQIQNIPIEKSATNEAVRTLLNGTILHGTQKTINNNLIFAPTSYYSELSGIGSAITDHPNYSNNSNFNVGVIGMGVATMSALCKKCSYMRFYEIDPEVIEISQTYFSNLKNLTNKNIKWDTVLGDARISMERELIDNPFQKFDVLALDAFSGDAVPVHLLTIEAYQLYLNHLNTDGILAIHISNKHLDLMPIIYNAAKHLDMNVFNIINLKDEEKLIQASSWMILTKGNNYKPSDKYKILKNFDKVNKNVRLWTDDYSNLFDILR